MLPAMYSTMALRVKWEQVRFSSYLGMNTGQEVAVKEVEEVW